MIQATTANVGCLVDGHWGQYAIARAVIVAQSFGYDYADAIDRASRHLQTMGPSSYEGLGDDEYEQLQFDADDVEHWLNANVAADGYSFGWHDGEFFYSASDSDDDA